MTTEVERVKGAGLRLAEPKSNKAKRNLRMPLVTLAAHREIQAAQLESAGGKWHNGDYFFTTSIGTPPPPDGMSRDLPAALAAAKLPKVRFHDLSHS
jgi:hypothetical protein